ncbi:hypothetical protein VUR80DRAFT_622 [Thermomyces stellatus]
MCPHLHRGRPVTPTRSTKTRLPHPVIDDQFLHTVSTCSCLQSAMEPQYMTHRVVAGPIPTTDKPLAVPSGGRAGFCGLMICDPQKDASSSWTRPPPLYLVHAVYGGLCSLAGVILEMCPCWRPLEPLGFEDWYYESACSGLTPHSWQMRRSQREKTGLLWDVCGSGRLVSNLRSRAP